MHLHLSSYLFPVALGLPLVLVACHHQNNEPTPLQNYITALDAEAQLIQHDPTALPHDRYAVTPSLYVPLGAANNRLVNSSGATIYEGGSALMTQMIQISADSSVITPIDPLDPLEAKDTYVLYTRAAIYVIEPAKQINSKIARTPALPS